VCIRVCVCVCVCVFGSFVVCFVCFFQRPAVRGGYARNAATEIVRPVVTRRVLLCVDRRASVQSVRFDEQFEQTCVCFDRFGRRSFAASVFRRSRNAAV
jgi:hypothetical protein